MSNFDTNVLNTAGVNPVNLYSGLTSRYDSTFYTAQSTLSASNFLRSTTLSATYTSNIAINDNITSATFTDIATKMPTASATDQTVYSTQQFFLTSIGVTLMEFVSAGTIGGKAIKGIAFNQLPFASLSPTVTTLSAYSGVKFNVNNGYNGQNIAFILDDRSTLENTVVIASAQTTGQLLTAANSAYPEQRRLALVTG